MVLAVSVDHPVLAVGADFQLEVGDVVRLLCLLGDGALCGDARQDFEELEVDLRREQWSRTLHTAKLACHESCFFEATLVQIGESDSRPFWSEARL